MSSGHTRIGFGVVIVAYNSSRLLQSCIDSVRSDPDVGTIVVIDNSSEEQAREVVQRIAAHDDRVRYVDPGENLGFAAGCNLGASHAAECSHLVFLNPDVRLERDLLGLVQPTATVTAGWLVSEHNPGAINARQSVTLWRELLKAIRGSGTYSERVLERAHRSDESWMPVDQVDGALLVIAKHDFESLGGFDEQFELYYDDVDLCMRAQSTLNGCLFRTARWGVHIGGESFSTSGGRAFRMSRISRIRYLRKHFGVTLATHSMALLIASTEFVTRSITRQPEGQSLRWKSFRDQLEEWRRPGSVRLLGEG